MAEKGIEQEKKHAVALTARQQISISGVTDVESFDDTSVQLVTDCGDLTLEGEGLHVGTLDIASGIGEVEGHISGLYYHDKTAVKKGLRGRLLR